MAILILKEIYPLLAAALLTGSFFAVMLYHRKAYRLWLMAERVFWIWVVLFPLSMGARAALFITKTAKRLSNYYIYVFAKMCYDLIIGVTAGVVIAVVTKNFAALGLFIPILLGVAFSLRLWIEKEGKSWRK